eukprot:1159058-Pelagomonas_calceolata.AAC.15
MGAHVLYSLTPEVLDAHGQDTLARIQCSQPCLSQHNGAAIQPCSGFRRYGEVRRGASVCPWPADVRVIVPLGSACSRGVVTYTHLRAGTVIRRKTQELTEEYYGDEHEKSMRKLAKHFSDECSRSNQHSLRPLLSSPPWHMRLLTSSLTGTPFHPIPFHLSI